MIYVSSSYTVCGMYLPLLFDTAAWSCSVYKYLCRRKTKRVFKDLTQPDTITSACHKPPKRVFWLHSFAARLSLGSALHFLIWVNIPKQVKPVPLNIPKVFRPGSADMASSYMTRGHCRQLYSLRGQFNGACLLGGAVLQHVCGLWACLAGALLGLVVVVQGGAELQQTLIPVLWQQ